MTCSLKGVYENSIDSTGYITNFGYDSPYSQSASANAQVGKYTGGHLSNLYPAEKEFVSTVPNVWWMKNRLTPIPNAYDGQYENHLRKHSVIDADGKVDEEATEQQEQQEAKTRKIADVVADEVEKEATAQDVQQIGDEQAAEPPSEDEPPSEEEPADSEEEPPSEDEKSEADESDVENAVADGDLTPSEAEAVVNGESSDSEEPSEEEPSDSEAAAEAEVSQQPVANADGETVNVSTPENGVITNGDKEGYTIERMRQAARIGANSVVSKPYEGRSRKQGQKRLRHSGKQTAEAYINGLADSQYLHESFARLPLQKAADQDQVAALSIAAIAICCIIALLVLIKTTTICCKAMAVQKNAVPESTPPPVGLAGETVNKPVAVSVPVTNKLSGGHIF